MLLFEVPKGARSAFRNLASPSALGRLTGIAQTRDWLDALERDCIERARKEGASWDEIGSALRVSVQRARSKAR